jgi:hypothetical protein
MPKLWHKPLYELPVKGGKKIIIDVTSSVSPGLPPNKAVTELTSFLKKKKLERILDFGAGALRHTIPLLDAGFQVCAVEFEECFARPVCSTALTQAKTYPNFSKLIYPKDFIRDNRRFDAALLCYVLQTMPVPQERKAVLRYLYKKLREDSYLLYMSRFNQLEGILSAHKVSDGFYKWPEREHHSFYREFTTEETHDFMDSFRLKRVKSLSERGTDQIFLYAKGGATWI